MGLTTHHSLTRHWMQLPEALFRGGRKHLHFQCGLPPAPRRGATELWPSCINAGIVFSALLSGVSFLFTILSNFVPSALHRGATSLFLEQFRLIKDTTGAKQWPAGPIVSGQAEGGRMGMWKGGVTLGLPWWLWACCESVQNPSGTRLCIPNRHGRRIHVWPASSWRPGVDSRPSEVRPAPVAGTAGLASCPPHPTSPPPPWPPGDI